MRVFLKKSIVVLSLLCLLFSITPVLISADGSGSCGDNVSWRLSGYYLTIEGSGQMTDYTEHEMAPWYSSRNDIRHITIESGVESVGSLAFYDCGELVSVSIPASVKSVGTFSFTKCKKLVNITGATGLENIGESAFEECESLVSFSFPSSLTNISTRAFYRCYSLITVLLPSSVTQMGSSVFAYCKALYSATINAAITALPVWTFYGCSSLTTLILPETVTSIGEYNFNYCYNLMAICYKGSYEEGSKILEEVKAADPDFPAESFIYSDGYTLDTPQSVLTTVDGDETSTAVTTVTETESATVSTTVTTITPSAPTDPAAEGNETETKTNPAVTVDAIVKKDDGWQEIIDEVKKTDETRDEDDTEPIEVNVTLSETSVISEDVLKQIADTNTTLHITTNTGSVVNIKSADLDADTIKKDYDISYTIGFDTELSEKQLETVGDAKTYGLTFNDNIDFNLTPMIYLGSGMRGQTATLYQKNGNKLDKLQSVVVDSSGYASFPLATVKESTEYVIAMNIKGETEEAIVPDSQKSDYGDTVNYQKIEYVETGVRKMFGLTIGQFALVAGGILVVFVLVIGAVMFVIFKAKSKNPEFDIKKKRK